jgi:hypothetical protein
MLRIQLKNSKCGWRNYWKDTEIAAIAIERRWVASPTVVQRLSCSWWHGGRKTFHLKKLWEARKQCKREGQIENLRPLNSSQCWYGEEVWDSFNFSQGTECGWWYECFVTSTFSIKKSAAAENNWNSCNNQKLTSSSPPLLADKVGTGRRWEAVPTAVWGLSCGGSRGEGLDFAEKISEQKQL